MSDAEFGGKPREAEEERRRKLVITVVRAQRRGTISLILVSSAMVQVDRYNFRAREDLEKIPVFIVNPKEGEGHRKSEKRGKRVAGQKAWRTKPPDTASVGLSAFAFPVRPSLLLLSSFRSQLPPRSPFSFTLRLNPKCLFAASSNLTWPISAVFP